MPEELHARPSSGLLPRAAQLDNLVIVIYKLEKIPALYVPTRHFFTHAWLPGSAQHLLWGMGHTTAYWSGDALRILQTVLYPADGGTTWKRCAGLSPCGAAIMPSRPPGTSA